MNIYGTVQHTSTVTLNNGNHVVYGGTTYLYTASASENGVSAWSITNNGSLRHVAGMGNDNGLWVSNPTALVSATTGGRSFLVLASAGPACLTPTH